MNSAHKIRTLSFFILRYYSWEVKQPGYRNCQRLWKLQWRNGLCELSIQCWSFSRDFVVISESQNEVMWELTYCQCEWGTILWRSVSRLCSESRRGWNLMGLHVMGRVLEVWIVWSMKSLEKLSSPIKCYRLDCICLNSGWMQRNSGP